MIPKSLKTALIRPHLKKTGLDTLPKMQDYICLNLVNYMNWLYNNYFLVVFSLII